MMRTHKNGINGRSNGLLAASMAAALVAWFPTGVCAQEAGSQADGGQMQQFYDEPSFFGIVAGPGTKISTLGYSNVVFIPGGAGGILLFHHLLLQGANFVVPAVSVPDDSSREVSMDCSGGLVGWVFSPQERLHLTAGTLVGAGSAEVVLKKDHSQKASLTFLAIEPFAELEANLYRGIRLFVGGTYRVMVGEDSAHGVDASGLSGPDLEFGFRMGGF